MAPLKKIVILGGSYGGMSTAHYLLRHALPDLPERESYQVVMVSAAAQTMSRPACPRALISDDMFPQDKLFVSIARQFEQYPPGSFEFVQATATKLDHAHRSVSVRRRSGQSETIEYHALVLATGASTPSPLLGLHDDEGALRASWAAFRHALPQARTIVIAGGGPAGIETAGELGEYLNGKPGWFAGPRDDPKVSIIVSTAGAHILPVLRPSLAEVAEDYLSHVGVTIFRHARVTHVSPAGAGTIDLAAPATVTLDDGRTLHADLYIPATGTRPNSGFVDPSLLAKDGRVNTNPATLRVDHAGPRVYAVGDVGSYARPAVHLIFNAIPVVGANIKRDLLLAAGADPASVGEDRVFEEDTRETQMVPIGTSKGVGAAMGFRLPSLLVWLIKGRDYWLWTTGRLWSGQQWAKP